MTADPKKGCRVKNAVKKAEEEFDERKKAIKKAAKKAVIEGLSKKEKKVAEDKAAKDFDDKKAKGEDKVEVLSKKLVKEVNTGVTEPACGLAKKLSKTISDSSKDFEDKDTHALEKDVAKMVIEAKDAKKNGKEPAKADGFKDAIKSLKEHLTKFLNK